MNITKTTIIITTILGLFSCHQTKEILVANQGEPYPWEITYKTEKHFSESSQQFFEVKYANKKIILPASLFGTTKPISKFLSAGIFSAADDNCGSVILTYYREFKKDNGFPDKSIETVIVKKLNNGKANEFLLTKLPGYEEQKFELVTE